LSNLKKKGQNILIVDKIRNLLDRYCVKAYPIKKVLPLHIVGKREVFVEELTWTSRVK